MSNNNEQKALDDLERHEGKERELPPLDKAERSKRKLPLLGSGKSNKVVVIGATVFSFLVVGVVFAVMTFVGGDKMESHNESLESEGRSSMVNLDELSPLAIKLPKMDEVSEPDALSDSDLSLEQVERSLNDLSELDLQLMAFDEALKIELSTLSGEIGTMRTLWLEKSEQDLSQSKRIEEIEKSLSALRSDIKRLKWLVKSKKKEVRKDRVAMKLRNVFVWQYRPGAEVEYKGVSSRVYEGDLLGGMRIVSIDVNLGQVVLSKNGKKTLLKMEER